MSGPVAEMVRAVVVVRLGIAELEARLNVDRSTIWRWYKAGKFPEPEYLGCDRRTWRLDVIETWEAEALARSPRARKSNLPARGAQP